MSPRPQARNLNGATPRQASGATLAALDADVRYVMTRFADNELSLMRGVWIMPASLAIRLSMMRTNQDNKAFPELAVNGGTFCGLPVIVSNNVTGSGSPGDQFLILMDQSEVLADEGQMDIDVSTQASVQMNDQYHRSRGTHRFAPDGHNSGVNVPWPGRHRTRVEAREVLPV